MFLSLNTYLTCYYQLACLSVVGYVVLLSPHFMPAYRVPLKSIPRITAGWPSGATASRSQLVVPAARTRTITKGSVRISLLPKMGGGSKLLKISAL